MFGITTAGATTVVSFANSILLRGYKTWNLLADIKKKNLGFRNQVPEQISPDLLLGAQDQRQGTEQNQLSCGSTRISSDNCQETEACMVRTCHTPRQPLQNHPSGHLGRWATPWSAEEMLDGQRQRVDIPAQCTTANTGLLQKNKQTKKLEEDIC